MKKSLKIIIPFILIFLFAFGTVQATIFTVSQGGTGVGTITGIIKGNGTAPFTATALTGNTSQFLNGAGAFTTVTAGSVPFSDITSGTNATAAMVVGTGATLNYNGVGITVSGDQSIPAWNANGPMLNSEGVSLNDNSTAAGATVSTAMTNSFFGPVITALNATIGSPVTYSTSATVYIDGAPTAGTNTLLLNAYSLFVESGDVFFGENSTTSGNNTIGGNLAIVNGSVDIERGYLNVGTNQLTSSNLYVSPGNTISASTSNASLHYGGFASVQYRGKFGSSSFTTTPNPLLASTNYGNLIISASPITAPTSGTTQWMSNLVVKSLGTVTNTSSIPITNTASLYVDAASTAGTSNYSAYFNGNVFVNGTVTSSGGSGVNSISNSDGSLTISPTTGVVVASVALGHSNFFTTNQSASSFGIGTGSTTPASTLQVVDTSTTTPRGILADEYATGTQGARITMRKARGTFASPTVIVTGDTLGSWTASGYDGTNFIDSGKILVTSTGTISTGIIPSTMALQTMNSSGTLTTGLLISSAQVVSLPLLVTNGIVTTSGGSGALSVTATTGSGNVVLATSPTITGGTLTTSSINGVTPTTAGSATAYLDGTGNYSTPVGTVPSIGGTLTSATAGSVLFAGSGTFAQDNANLFYNSTSKFFGIGATPASRLTIGGNFTGAAWGGASASAVLGPAIQQVGATFTDNSTAAGATIVAVAINTFGANTITASLATSGSKVTYTNMYGTYFNQVALGANTLVTNNYTLGVNGNMIALSNLYLGASDVFLQRTTGATLTVTAGTNTFFTGPVTSLVSGTGIAFNSANGGANFTTASAGSPTIGTSTWGGVTTANYRVQAGGGTTSTTIGAGNNYAALLVPSSVITKAGSGNHPFITNAAVLSLGTIGAGSATVGSTASLYVGGANTSLTVSGGNYSLYVDTGLSAFNGSISLLTAGSKLNIATGSNASVGTATLSGGTVTVSTTAVTASSKIFLTDATTGVLTNVGSMTVGTITAGASFVINSTNPLDASNVNWFIIN